ncbi:hypothetical protein ABW19_dt0201521 [Dactylella cylindrospora]|nr:hypothetical protein ABW19_dt0201521 [Dactylella cylindrospora]
MFSKNILFVAATAFFAFTQALPTYTPPFENPFPSNDSYIHFKPSDTEKLAIRGLVRRVTAPSCSDPTQCQTNDLIFAIANGEFINGFRNQGVNTPPLIYDSDGCSVPKGVANALGIDKNAPFGYDYLNSCFRHDFGYRNFKAQTRFTDDNRERLDDKFLEDMHAQCDNQFGRWYQFISKFWCKKVAGIYFLFVRLCGNDQCTIDRAKEILKDVLNWF